MWLHSCWSDYLKPKHFLQVRSALERFQDNLAGPRYFFMCFFVNNQYRIIVEEMSSGSDNLENVFESNLQRIGSMVAILDTWDRPLYLSRIWTVYEQFVASTIHIEVGFWDGREIGSSKQGFQQVLVCAIRGHAGWSLLFSCLMSCSSLD